MLRTTSRPAPGNQHFAGLDALRGVAAIAVAIFHACAIFGATQLLPKAFLAVDFFFLLSGIVVAHAYEDRLRRGESLLYIRRRAVRLYPMIWLGAGIGMSYLLTSPAVRQMPFTAVILLGLSSVLCIPVLRENVFPGSSYVTPVNIPSWSLFFELFVNVLYGVIAKRLTNLILIIVVLVSFFAECFSVIHFNAANVGAYVENFQWGFARVLFPFFLGVLINRAIVPRGRSPSSKTSVFLATVLVATLAVPSLGGWTGIGEMIAIAIVFPLVVITAMQTTAAPRERGLFAKLGAISYPLYAMHVPLFLWMARLQRLTEQRFPVSPGWWAASAIAMSLLVAWVVYKLYDVPFREALSGMSRRDRSRASVEGA